MELKNLTASVYTFEKLVDGGYLYVDKTGYLWELLKEPCGIYFLSRPRRFGKSLTISTLKAIFQNKRQLFKGLALDTLPFVWKECPVIHLDFASKQAKTAAELDAFLANRVAKAAQENHVRLKSKACDDMFLELVEKLAKDVVILIDEYDKPLLDNIDNPALEEIRAVMESFFIVVKATEPCQRFVLLTGVSKFAQVSVFSKLNNLQDLSMDPRVATMLGYTQDELEANFAGHIDAAAAAQGVGRAELLEGMRLWYNGYRFEEKAATVYNPVSVAKFFESGGKFKNHWFATATPSFLLKLAKSWRFDFQAALSEPVGSLAFEAYDVKKLSPLPLLFQTGYLTIKSSVREGYETFYQLGFPNREVEASFEAYLLEEYAGAHCESVEVDAAAMAKALNVGDLPAFMAKLRVFFASVPYDIQLKDEKYYQTIFYILFRLLGLRVEAEARTSRGRVDAVAMTKDAVYLFEFKLDQTAESAMAQIKRKDYFRRYLESGRKVVLVAAAFDSGTRNIEEWQVDGQ